MRLSILLFIAAMACNANPQASARVDAAGVFTKRYAHSALSVWKVRGAAAGSDCDILLIKTSVVMDDAMVEALHYGGGAYGVVDGGVQRFYRDRAFRGVAYRDAAGHVWRYGDVTRNEAETLKPCG